MSRVVVIGQGYVGLPLAVRAAEVGHTVVALDLDERRIEALRDGRSYIEDITSDDVRDKVAAGRLIPTTSYEDAAGFDVAIIAVPTPLREATPDLSFISSAGRSLAPHLTRGATVVLESTTYPGTTEELLLPELERGSGLTAGVDFFLGYSPERIDPGNKHWRLTNTPKLVSGIDAESLARVEEFYSDLVESTIATSGTREAELAKLLENTFRHVNIALVNEMAIFAHQLGVDIWESIRAASTKPFGFMPFTPGPGVGGHCLPVDPSFLSWEVKRRLGQTFRFVELANDVNEHMPDYVVQRLASMLNGRRMAVNGSRILLAGLAYKRNSGDVREAPAHRIIELLHELGATVMGADPHVDDALWPAGVERVQLDEPTIRRADACVLVTDHDVFDLSLLQEGLVDVLDTRDALRPGDRIERY